jgi:hypothetical protein
VEPSRRITGPTGVEVLAGGGGVGLGAGVGCGGVGWVMVLPNGGGVGVAGWGLITSASLGASSSRVTPSGGSPSRSSTVFPTLTWEFHRLSIPGRTRPPNISSGTRPVGLPTGAAVTGATLVLSGAAEAAGH